MKRVFMLSTHPLFSRGVESLLRQETGLEIVGRETDVDKAIERIRELRPDVVIVDSGDPACDPVPAVICILREGLGTRVIGLNLQDNTLCIYRGEQRVVQEVEDLVEAIEPGPLWPEPVSSEDLARLGQVAEPGKKQKEDEMTENTRPEDLNGENSLNTPKKGETTMSSNEKEQKRITRREFVKGAAVGAAGVAATGALAACGPTPTPEVIKETVEVTKVVEKEVPVEVIKEVEVIPECPPCPVPGVPETWDEEADVVVVGFGGAGAGAAIEAADAGAKVLILEKMREGEEGGASRICGGILGWKGIIGPGLIGDIDGIRANTFGAIDEEYAHAYSEALEDLYYWLEDMGLEMTGTIDTILSVAPKGDYFGAQVLWAALKEQVNKRGISVLYETPGRELIQDPVTKEILGVAAENGGGQIAVKAKRAVVLTNGSYGANLEMLNAFNHPGVYIATKTSPANTGDGHKMGMRVGARLWHMGMGVEWGTCALKVPSQLYNTALQFNDVLPSHYIFVDKHGKRFINEKLISSSHYKGHLAVLDFKGELAVHATLNEYLHIPFFVVFDEKLREAGRLALAEPYTVAGTTLVAAPNGWYAIQKPYDWSADNSAEIAKGWIVKADTIEELATKITGTDWYGQQVGVDPAGLVDTVSKYNEYCAAGEDLEFGRPGPLPIDTPPYYAAEVCPQATYTIGGLEHNARCQTMGVDDRPIPRLYSAGDVGQVGHIKPDGVAGAMAFGRIAGKNAAAEKPWG